jgi:hypothetical protein
METNTLRTGVAAVGVALAYGISCWRIFRRFRGDKFIECASITTFLLMGVIAVHRIPNVPSWVVKAILPLMGLFCWLSVYFGLQQAYHAIRHRKTNGKPCRKFRSWRQYPRTWAGSLQAPKLTQLIRAFG